MEKEREGGRGRVRPARALLAGLPLWALLLLGTWLLVPPGEGTRTGVLLGLVVAGLLALAAFGLKVRSFRRGGTAFLGAMAGGFLGNLLCLVAGVLLLRYLPAAAARADHQGYAFGYLAGALLLGGLFTWFLRHGR